jgi:hypothetical protein
MHLAPGGAPVPVKLIAVNASIDLKKTLYCIIAFKEINDFASDNRKHLL